jgi:hypothetical protein
MRGDVKIFDFFIVILIMIFIALLPLIYTVVLGTYLAAVLGLTGFVWWNFIILFTISLYGLMWYLIGWSISKW